MIFPVRYVSLPEGASAGQPVGQPVNLCHGTVFVVEELRGQGFGQFGFAHPCGPSEEEGASFAGKLEVIHPLF